MVLRRPAAVALLFVFLAACGSSKPDATPLPLPSPTPTVTAALFGQRQATDAAAATPTPVPPLDRAVVLDFVLGHITITSDWQQFHADFDSWRETLTSCDGSALRTALGRFAGELVGITEDARRLPRNTVTNGPADKVIAATEREGSSLRVLRDTWQPGNPAVFAAVDADRSSDSTLLKEAEDRLGDLQSMTSLSTRTEVDRFSRAFDALNADWDAFLVDYDAFRGEEAALDSADTILRLSELIDSLRDIVIAARELPTVDVTEEVAAIVSRAVEAEDLALRSLRGTFEKSEDESDASSTPGSSPVKEAGASTDGLDSGEVGTTTPVMAVFVPRDPELFTAFDAELVRANSARRQAVQQLAGVLREVSEDNRAAVDEFATEYEIMVQRWDRFHQDYDAWRVSEGGCNRVDAGEALGQFVLRFGELADKVRALPRATFLQPLGELLVEAAEVEEGSLRTLRNT